MHHHIKIFYDSLHFEDVARELCADLCRTWRCTITHVLDSAEEKRVWSSTLYVCFGMHEWVDMRNLPPQYIVMQLEPVCVRGLSERYLLVMRRALAVFEYSALNVPVLREHNIASKKIHRFHVGVAHDLPVPSDTEPRPFDIVFVGEMTTHRERLFARLRQRFPDAHVITRSGVWGTERDALLRRARIALNVHATPGARFPLETPRLLACAQAGVPHIMSEPSGDLSEERRWADLAVFVTCAEMEKRISDILGANDTDRGTQRDTQIDTSRDTTNVADMCSAPRIVHAIAQVLQRARIEPCVASCDEPEPAALRWFDPTCAGVEDIDVCVLPDVQTFPHEDLPTVSVVTLTTPARALRWERLMRWNQARRVYPIDKLEWIVVCEEAPSEHKKTFAALQRRMAGWPLAPRWISFASKQDLAIQIAGKRNAGVQAASHAYIDMMDDDDIEVPDGLLIKIIALMHTGKRCVGSSRLLCYDLRAGILFTRHALFPTESTLTFVRGFGGSEPFQPSMHGEGFHAVVDHWRDVANVPCALNTIAVTHGANITGNSRTAPDRRDAPLATLADFVGHASSLNAALAA